MNNDTVFAAAAGYGAVMLRFLTAVFCVNSPRSETDLPDF
jgi:hypothetical protein